MKFLRQHLPYQDGGHVALRRKMFKMGGDINTHGVGITSGLAYNTGGAVAPIGQVGKGPLQKRGPDGKMREMQNPLRLLSLIPKFIKKPLQKK